MQDLRNRNYRLEEVLLFLQEHTGQGPVAPDADILADLGVFGEGFNRLVRAFSIRFQVDTTSYLWYFHTDEESQTIGSLFFKPPYERVRRIPVTPLMLLHFAQEGHWAVHYPDHQIPSSRADFFINILVLIGILFLLLYVSGNL